MTIELPDPTTWPVGGQVAAATIAWYVLAGVVVRLLDRYTTVFEYNPGPNQTPQFLATQRRGNMICGWVISPFLAVVVPAVVLAWVVASVVSCGVVPFPWSQQSVGDNNA